MWDPTLLSSLEPSLVSSSLYPTLRVKARWLVFTPNRLVTTEPHMPPGFAFFGTGPTQGSLSPSSQGHWIGVGVDI